MSTFFETIRDPEITRRFQETVELFETAQAIQGQNLRRRHPELTEEEIQQRVQEWLLDQPDDHVSPMIRRSSRLSRFLDRA